MKELIKIDRNGTKYWREMVRCPKCGGSGSLAWTDYADGVCFDCHGAGVYEEIIKEYTPEHQAKLEAQRAKRAEKRMAERRAEAQETNLKFFSREGFNADGETWAVLGDTYSIKDELKAQGFKFNYSSLGWHGAHDLEEYPTIKLTASEILNANDFGEYHSWNNQRIDELMTEAQRQLRASTATSEYVGSVGEKIEVRATLTRCHSYKTRFNWKTITHFINIFTDESGNVFVWNSTAFFDAGVGDQVILKGTIKGHSEYEGIKQTELQRCKITKEVK